VADVFVSYASEDRPVAEQISRGLEGAGFSVWWDRHIHGGVNFGDEIQRQLNAARIVVVLWSADSLDSSYVRDEAQQARDEKKLIPVRLDSVQPPLGFRQTQSLDFGGWNGDANAGAFVGLVNSARNFTSGATPSASVSPSSFIEPQRSRWAGTTVRYIAAAVALMVVAGVLTVLLRLPSGPAPLASDGNQLQAASPTSASARATETNTDPPGITGFAGRPAIAVLPFENLSADPAQAFLGDGLADDLIARLSSWREVPVIARSSSFRYRGDNVDVKRMAAELGVRYVVEGSVRRAGDHIRISAQLIDAATGTNVWNKTYDREIGDLFALQDEISSAIASSLIADLSHAEGERAQQRGTQNLDAWSLFQLGLQRDKRNTPEDWVAGRALFEKAVAQDPRFSSAQAMLAVHLVYALDIDSNVDPQKRAREVTTALGIARHAVELDPRDAIAHFALGQVYLHARNLQDGLDSIKRAVDLNPSAAFAWQAYADAKISAGDPEAALAACQEATRLDPQGTQVPWIENDVAQAYWMMGRYQEGLEAARRAVAGMPGYWFAYEPVVTNAIALGRMDEARAAIAEARRVQPNLSLELVQQGNWFARPELNARRLAALRKAGLE